MLSVRRFSAAGFGRGLVISLLCAGPAGAQTAELQAVSRTLTRNQEQLSLYGWISRTEVTVGDELQLLRLLRVTYDAGGGLRRKPLEGEPASPQKSGKLNKKTRAFLDALEQLTDTYTALDPRTMREAFSRAHAWQGRGEQARTLRIQVRGVVRQGDRLDLWVDTVTKRPRRLEVLTSLRGEGVRLTTEFEDLIDGPSHAALIVVETELKEKKMLVRTENYDYAKRGD